MEDKRLINRLTAYWNRLRQDKRLPAWEHFNVSALEDLWGQCCVWRVDVAGEGRRVNQYTYEYVGSSAKEAMGMDLTGTVFVSKIQSFPGARVAAKVEEAVEAARPLLDEGTFVNDKNKVVKYRSCLLPFGTKDGKVTRLVLGLSWRMF